MADDKFSFDFDIDDYLHFRVVRFNGAEGISRPFHFEIYLALEGFHSETFNDDLIGKPATLHIYKGNDSTFINGIASRFLQIGESGNFTAFYAELMPDIWYLTQRHGCRIFQDLSVPEIIKKVLEEGAKLTSMHYDFRLHKEYQKRDFCVQYRESEFNFISRLMEEEGIFYYFEHHQEPIDDKISPAKRSYPWRHTLVLGDHPSCHKDISDNADKPKEDKSKMKFHESTGQVATEEHVYEFNYAYQIRPGAATLRDYNYMRNLKLHASAPLPAKRFRSLEFYDYPGKFNEVDEGKKLAQIRLEEMRAKYEAGIGRSNCLRLVPGSCFTLDGHSQKAFDQKYLLVSVSHTGRQATDEESRGDWAKLVDLIDKGIDSLLSFLPSIGPLSPQQIYHEYRKGLSELLTKEVLVYRNEFECIPSSTPYRPPRLTPKPVVQGPQTAIVVGPKNDEKDKDKKELYMDEMGRAKVQFHWDREGKNDENSSCWIRVAYNYAGIDHGLQIHPLVGDEVVVNFLEGDPDKPLIVGSVYNGDNRPPLKPENRIENIILTPYQHRLLLSDREASITLNTGGHEVIGMIDGKEDSEYGKEIKISTADHHAIHLCKGTKVSGIKTETEIGQKLVMWDEPHPAGILLEDKEKNLSMQLNSDEKIIIIKNKSDQQIRIDCQRGQVSIIGGGVEVIGGEVRITGSKSVKINSDAEITINAPHIKLAAAMIDLNSPMVSCSGVVKCDTLISNSVVSSSYTPGAGNIW
jgi:Rhs element Vgr protein